MKMTRGTTMEKSTNELQNEIKNLKEDNLDAWMKENTKIRFADYFDELQNKYGIHSKEIEEMCMVSRSEMYKIKRGENQPKRETVIRLALGMGVTLDETNRMLKLANYSNLYVKDKDDAIIIFGLENKKSVFEIDEMLMKRGSSFVLIDR